MDHVGPCLCGAVEVTAAGSPEAMGYRHCRSCRSSSGGPVDAFSLWQPDAVRVTKGAEQVALCQARDERTQILREMRRASDDQSSPAQPGRRFAATIPTLAFTPAVHVDYAKAVPQIRDGLPKQKDFPAEFGGSGEFMDE